MMDKFIELPFGDEPYDIESARLQEYITDSNFDRWLESLRETT